MTGNQISETVLSIAALNTWEAQVDGYIDWAGTELAQYDIICLSEVHSDSRGKTDQTLVPVPNQFELLQEKFGATHRGYFAKSAQTREGVDYGLALFHRYPLRMFGIQCEVVHGAYDAPWRQPRLISSCSQIQSGLIDCGSSWLLCANIHGLWKKSGKFDCPERVQQNLRIRRHLRRRIAEFTTPHKPVVVLLCGDFNYTRDMQAFRDLSAAPEFGLDGALVLNSIIPDGYNTRTRHYTKVVKEADFMLLSQEHVQVLNFNVNRNAKSDHAILDLLLRVF